MEKYDEMIKKNKFVSETKVNQAVQVITELLMNDEKVSVHALVNRTGFSRAFFYNNEKVHAELLRAYELQQGKNFVSKKQVVIDKAMDKELRLLKESNEDKDKTISELKCEIAKLKKGLNARDLVSISKL